MIRSLEHNVPSQARLEELLQRELVQLDDSHAGKNNWNSLLVAGLLDPPVTTWLYDHLSAAGRAPDDPLI